MMKMKKYMVLVNELKYVALVLMFILPINMSGQLSYESGDKDLPKMLQKAYKDRSVIIKNDTLSYKQRWFIPDEYKLQYAGDIGFMSLGVGYRITPVYHPALYFGYVSEHFGGGKNSVTTVSLKNQFYLFGDRLFKGFRPYSGFSLNWMSAHNSFRHLPDYYPDNYYFQNKLHLIPYIGAEKKLTLNWNYFDEVGLYAELGVFDAYLLEAIRTDYITLSKVASLGIGLTFYLR